MCVAMAACISDQDRRDRLNREAKRQHEERLRTEYTSLSSTAFCPDYADNLQQVDVQGKASLHKAKRLISVKASCIELFECRVRGDIHARSGTIECFNSVVKGTINAAGTKVLFKWGAINELVIKAPPVNKKGKSQKQVVEIVDSYVKTIRIINGRCDLTLSSPTTAMNMTWESPDKLFKLVFKKVKVESVTTSEE